MGASALKGVQALPELVDEQKTRRLLRKRFDKELWTDLCEKYGIHETEEKLLNYLGKRTNKLKIPRRCLLDAFSRRAFAERSGRSTTSTTAGMPTDTKKDKGDPSDSVSPEAMEHSQTLSRVGAHVYPKFRNGRYDIIIVGTGLRESLLALLLAQQGLHVLHIGRDANLRPRKVVRHKTPLATDNANPALQSTGADDPPLEAKSPAMTIRDAATAPESKTEDERGRPDNAGFHFSDLAATTLQDLSRFAVKDSIASLYHAASPDVMQFVHRKTIGYKNIIRNHAVVNNNVTDIDGNKINWANFDNLGSESDRSSNSNSIMDSIAFVLPPRQLKAQEEKRQSMVPPLHHPHDYKREGRAYLDAHPDEYRLGLCPKAFLRHGALAKALVATGVAQHLRRRIVPVGDYVVVRPRWVPHPRDADVSRLEGMHATKASSSPLIVARTPLALTSVANTPLLSLPHRQCLHAMVRQARMRRSQAPSTASYARTWVDKLHDSLFPFEPASTGPCAADPSPSQAAVDAHVLKNFGFEGSTLRYSGSVVSVTGEHMRSELAGRQRVVDECFQCSRVLRSGLLLSDYMHYHRNPNPGVAESRFKLTPAPDMAEVERVLGPGFALPWSEVLRTAMDGYTESLSNRSPSWPTPTLPGAAEQHSDASEYDGSDDPRAPLSAFVYPQGGQSVFLEAFAAAEAALDPTAGSPTERGGTVTRVLDEASALLLSGTEVQGVVLQDGKAAMAKLMVADTQCKLLWDTPRVKSRYVRPTGRVVRSICILARRPKWKRYAPVIKHASTSPSRRLSPAGRASLMQRRGPGGGYGGGGSDSWPAQGAHFVLSQCVVLDEEDPCANSNRTEHNDPATHDLHVNTDKPRTSSASATVKRHDVGVLCLSGKYHQVCPEGQFVLSVSTVVETDTPLRELDQAFELLDDTDIILQRFNFVTPTYAPVNDSYKDHLYVLPSHRSVADSHFEGAMREVQESIGAVQRLLLRYRADELHEEELERQRELARLAAIQAQVDKAAQMRAQREREVREAELMKEQEDEMREFLRQEDLLFTDGFFKIKTNMGVYQRYYVTFSPVKARGEEALLVTWYRSKKLLKRPVNQVRITSESSTRAIKSRKRRNSSSSMASGSDSEMTLSDGELSDTASSPRRAKKRKKRKPKPAWVLENTEPGPKANAKESKTNRIEARAGSSEQLRSILFTLELLIEAAVVSGESV